MKNIHVLPTDKPSRLLKSDFKITLLDIPSNEWKKPNINIYITSDEEIKEGDWYYLPKENKIAKCPKILKLYSVTPEWTQKIILTTDQDLIKDGVQAIDDRFLEWFVNNPSCEEVEVEEYYSFEIGDWTYKIIVPRTTQQIIDEDYSSGLTLGQIIPKEEPKQETLEEAASRCAIQENRSSLYELGMKYFQLGAKWQKEQDNNKYSDEDVIELLKTFDEKFNSGIVERNKGINNWFEQFKKK